jgi:SAM-dependent methyltransferase
MNDVPKEDKPKRTDWNRRYREGFYKGTPEPHALLRRFWTLIPGNLVVDIAMGSGRDALFLARKGFFVTGLEDSIEAINIAKKAMLEKNLSLLPILGDADHIPYRRDSFDCLLVFYFLKRGIMKEIRSLLRRGGILMYETFLKRQNRFDRPRNPDYLLGDGELLGYFKGFEILLYEEIVENEGCRKKAVARIVGRKQ